VEKGITGVDNIGEIGVGVELQNEEEDGEWADASATRVFMLLSLWRLLYCFKRSGAFS
jgi:hypothetical protein